MLKSITIKWRINRKKITFPASLEYIHTGEEIIPSWPEFEGLIEVVGGDVSVTDVGYYQTTVVPTKNYCWMDGSTDPYTIDWVVMYDKIIEVIPSQSGRLIYNGEKLFPAWDNYDPLRTELAVNAQTDVGVYEAVFTPKRGYKWADETTEPKSVYWFIDKAQSEITLSTEDVALDVQEQLGILQVNRKTFEFEEIGAPYAQYVEVNCNLPKGFTVSTDSSNSVEVEILDEMPQEGTLSLDKTSLTISGVNTTGFVTATTNVPEGVQIINETPDIIKVEIV